MEARDIETIEKSIKGNLKPYEIKEFKLRMMYDNDFGILYDYMIAVISTIRNLALQTTLEEKIVRLENTIHLIDS